MELLARPIAVSQLRRTDDSAVAADVHHLHRRHGGLSRGLELELAVTALIASVCSIVRDEAREFLP